MIQRLSNNLQINIPYKTLFKSQRYQLKRLNESLSNEYNFIGQFKLSPRMTTILLAYIFRLMQLQGKNKIYFICESKARCRQVKDIAERLKQYYKRDQQTYLNLTMNKTPSQQQVSSKQQFKLQNSQIVIMQRFFHKQLQLLKDYPHDKYLSILSINEYFDQLIQQKLNNPKSKFMKANYLFIQTVAFDQIVQTSISGWINQIIIRRAFIQYKKLSKHYHERQDKKKLLLNKNINTTIGQGQQSINGNQMFSSFQRQKYLEATDVQKKINDFYIHKKKALLKTADKNIKKTNNQNKKNIQQQQTVNQDIKFGFQQEAFINLDLVGYLINWLQSYQIQTRQSSKTSKQQGSTQQNSSTKFLQMLQKKLLLNLDMLKKMYPTLKKLLQLYPPIVSVNSLSNPSQQQQNISQNSLQKPHQNTKILSSRHILHLTKFFYDLIRFDEVFNQKYNQCIQVVKSSYRQKQKTSFFEIKFRCLNQPLLTQLMLQFNQKYIVMMNNGIPFQFYTTVFNPKILLPNQTQMKKLQSIKIQQQVQNYEHESLSSHHQTLIQSQKGFKISFISPLQANTRTHSNIYGLNVTITPSQQNLTIPELLHSKQQQQHDSLIIKAYGVLIYDICEIISDGIIVYFPSHYIMNKFKKQWIEKQDIYKRINIVKKIYQETQYQLQNDKLIQQYKKVCDIGRGAIFFITVNGGMAKYVSFHQHYSRCVVFLGFPKIVQVHKKKQTHSDKQKQYKIKRQNYFNLKQSQLQAIYGLKTTAKCLSNCINSIIQPKCVIFADVLYNKKNSRKWFPFMKQGNLSTLQVIQKLKKYYQNCEIQYEQKLNEQIIRNNQNANSHKLKYPSLNSLYSLNR